MNNLYKLDSAPLFNGMLEILKACDCDADIAKIAAESIKKAMSPLIQKQENKQEIKSELKAVQSTPEDLYGIEKLTFEQALDVPIGVLYLNRWGENALKQNNIKTIKDLVNRSEDDLLKLPKFGRTIVNNIKQELHNFSSKYGLTLQLGMKL